MTKRQREDAERKQRLLTQATALDGESNLVAGRTYRIQNSHHLEHGRLAEVTFTPGAALRHAVENPAAWTIWSGWCPGQAIVKVDGRTSWVSPYDLAPLPEVGMGITQVFPQDRYAYTIVEVEGPKRIVVQQDTATCTDPPAKSMGDLVNREQHYEFTRNPKAPRITLTLRKNGRWTEVGGRMGSGCSWSIGQRIQYRDWGG